MQNNSSTTTHLFVIVRIDLYDNDNNNATILSGKLLSSTKAFRSKEDAEKEAGRLNELNGSEYTRYVVILTRFVDVAEK